MSAFDLPANYVRFNSLQTKEPIVVVKIAGVADLITNRGLVTKILYGDPGVIYGVPGLVYGGLKPYLKYLPGGGLSSFRPYLDLSNNSPTISQRLEPEQGKGSVSTLSLTMLDFDQFMTQLCSPGVIIPEIMGAEIQVYLGYANISFPQDFFQIFRGYITDVSAGPGSVTLQISDPNLKRRQQLFYIQQTPLQYGVSATDTLLTLQSNAGFFQQIPQPLGAAYNSSIHNYVQIDSEWIECEPILQGSLGYSAFIQGITYTPNNPYTTGISIYYVDGATAGSEVVTVAGLRITVQIQAGVSTASQVAFAINNNAQASVIVNASVFAPQASLAQTPQGPTYIALTTYAAANISGIVYISAQGYSNNVAIQYLNTVPAGSESVSVSTETVYQATIQGVTYSAAPGHSTDVNIAYVSGAVAGSETVAVSGSNIVVTMQPGSSTASQIAFAISNSSAAQALVLQPQVNPALASLTQVLQSATYLSAQTVNLITVNIQTTRSTNAQILADLRVLNSIPLLPLS